ncbi:MAG: hypothetical protein K1X57_19695 [Gemmataceae bacterium]|nr:hypothetical protein [Gemmataceae bacterium]
MVGYKITRRFKAIDPGTGTVIRREKVLEQGLCRRTINKQIGRIKRVFAWAVEEELVEVAVHAALLRVRGLRRNETNAREKPRVRPVSQDNIDAVLLRLPPVVRSMVEVQLLSDARPQEVAFMGEEDIVRDGPVWEYRPRRYKTEHHNQVTDPYRDRVNFLGPRAHMDRKCQQQPYDAADMAQAVYDPPIEKLPEFRYTPDLSFRALVRRNARDLLRERRRPRTPRPVVHYCNAARYSFGIFSRGITPGD